MGSQARFNGPIGVAVSADGTRIVVADTYNDRIRVIDQHGMVHTLAGTLRPGARDGVGDVARFHTPSGVAVDAAGTIVVADTGNGLLRRVDPTGAVTTLPASFPEGLVRPTGVAVNLTGDLYVTDDRGRLYEASRDGAVRTLAGSRPGFSDGDGASARFRTPRGSPWWGRSSSCWPTRATRWFAPSRHPRRFRFGGLPRR